jgi:hypothetical protein
VIFYQKLRPEFVRSYKTPLSSDAFCRFGHLGKEIHNRDVRTDMKNKLEGDN